MPGHIEIDMAMAHEYWNTISLLTATLLILWLMRSLRNFYRTLKVRAALLAGRVVQVRGLGSYVHYLEGATTAHANHIMHTRQVEHPAAVSSVYNPVTIGAVKVSVVDAERANDRRLRYHVEVSTSVPCKIMVMTDFQPDTFKRKVDDPAFGSSNTGTGGGLLSRSNSRSNLAAAGGGGSGGGGGRSRSNSRSSGRSRSGSISGNETPAWLEMLEKEATAAGGQGMGMHGLLERSEICHSASAFTHVPVGIHSLELESRLLNLDRFVAPMQHASSTPPVTPSGGKVAPVTSGSGDFRVRQGNSDPSASSMEEGNAAATAADGSVLPPPQPAPKTPPTDVMFGLLVVPEGSPEVGLHIADAQTSFTLAHGDTLSLEAAAAAAGGAAAPEAAVRPPDGTTEQQQQQQQHPGMGRRDRPFLNLLREIFDAPIPANERGSSFLPGENDGIPPQSGDVPLSSAAQGKANAAPRTEADVQMSNIVERKKLLATEASAAMDPAFTLLSLSAGVRTMTEAVQNGRSGNLAAGAAGAAGGGDMVGLSPKELLLGANGVCYTSFEIFGLASEQISTTFLEMTVLNQEKEDGTTKVKYVSDAPSDDMFADDCLICMSDVKQVMMMPCRHFCVCPLCLVKIDKCPVCRSAFEEYVVITKGDKTGSHMTVPTIKQRRGKGGGKAAAL
jgi:hypothetical protein